MAKKYFELDNLSVGYGKNILRIEVAHVNEYSVGETIL